MKRGVSTWQRWVWLALLYSPALWASREGAGIAEGLAWLFGLLLLFGIGSALGELCSGVLKLSVWWLLILPIMGVLVSYFSFDLSAALGLSIIACSVGGWIVGAIIGRYPTLVYMLVVLWIMIDIIAMATMFSGDTLVVIAVLPNIPWLFAVLVHRLIWPSWIGFFKKLHNRYQLVNHPERVKSEPTQYRLQIISYVNRIKQRINQNGWWRWLFCSLLVYSLGFILVTLVPMAWVGEFFTQLGVFLNQPTIDLSLGPQRLWQDFGGSPSVLVGGLWAWWWGS